MSESLLLLGSAQRRTNTSKITRTRLIGGIHDDVGDLHVSRTSYLCRNMRKYGDREKRDDTGLIDENVPRR